MVMELINLSPSRDQTVIVQAGAFAEHAFSSVRYTACADGSWTGGLYDYGHRDPATESRHAAGTGGPWLTVRLPASTRIRLTLTLAMRSRTPSYATPFDADYRA
jgi:hypothetical protein